MTTDDQRAVIAFLSTPEAYLLRASLVERIDTHISIVWLAGDRVYKLKRAVRFDYVDFSTIELRRIACEAEVRLNRRTAPSLYLGVRPVTREAGGALALGGQGEPIDWVVEMVRFDQDTLFDRLAERHQLATKVNNSLLTVVLLQIDPAKAAGTSEYNGKRRRHGRANIARSQPKEKHHE